MARKSKSLARLLSARPKPLGLLIFSVLSLLALSIFTTLAQLTRVAWDQWRQPLLATDSWALTTSPTEPVLPWLLSQHNEHRIFFSRLASLFDIHILKIPPTSTFLFQTFLATLLCCGLLALLCRWLSASPILVLLTWLPGVALLVNPWQWENYRWEFQLPWFHINTLVLLSTLAFATCLSKPSLAVNRFVSAYLLVAPWLALFSSGQGMALISALVLISWALRPRLFAGITLSSILALTAYFIGLGYEAPLSHPDLSFNPDYFSRLLLGGNWSGLALTAFSLGALSLLLVVHDERVASWQSKQKICIAALPAIFAMLFAGMTTLSRSGYGLEQALAPRYVTHTLMLPLSCLLIWECLLEESRLLHGNRFYRLGTLLAAMIVLFSTLFSLPQILFSSRPSSFRENLGLIRLAREDAKKEFLCHAGKSKLERDSKAQSGKVTPQKKCGANDEVFYPLARSYFLGEVSTKPTGWHKQLIDSVSR